MKNYLKLSSLSLVIIAGLSMDSFAMDEAMDEDLYGPYVEQDQVRSQIVTKKKQIESFQDSLSLALTAVQPRESSEMVKLDENLIRNNLASATKWKKIEALPSGSTITLRLENAHNLTPMGGITSDILMRVFNGGEVNHQEICSLIQFLGSHRPIN